VARVTVEDCLEKIPNRFELIHIAAKRVKQMAKGSKSMLGGFQNKPAVMALREIAGGFVQKVPSEEGEFNHGGSV
jgi:DNA-directed RNA polymerase subunit omega